MNWEKVGKCATCLFPTKDVRTAVLMWTMRAGLKGLIQGGDRTPRPASGWGSRSSTFARANYSFNGNATPSLLCSSVCLRTTSLFAGWPLPTVLPPETLLKHAMHKTNRVIMSSNFYWEGGGCMRLYWNGLSESAKRAPRGWGYCRKAPLAQKEPLGSNPSWFYDYGLPIQI